MKLLITFLTTTSIMLQLVGCSSDSPDGTNLQPALPDDNTGSPNGLRTVPPRTKSGGSIDGKETSLAKDLRLLRKTTAISGQRKASSLEAIEAARRIFGRINLLGMTKENVLWMLGNPETISDFGLKAGPLKEDPLIYRMDGGSKPFDWIIRFKDGWVTAVEERGPGY